MKFSTMSNTVKVLVGCLCITIAIFFVSLFYYERVNSAEDPRTLPAKTLQLQYEKQLREEQTSEALDILNSMLKIYQKTPGYEKSYEIGVIYNNIASVYLVQLETELLTNENLSQDDLAMNLNLSAEYLQKSIDVYEQWLDEMGQLTEMQIKQKLEPFFTPEDPSFQEVDFNAVFEKRTEDIKIAQIETVRRLSVALTNLGVFNRYQGNLELAKANYEKAINLWDRNYTAKDNLNVLMNQPVQKRSMIDRLFPPEKSHQ